jgi:chromate transport protein ChrA
MNDHPIKVALDTASVGALIATLAGWLPSVAALFTIIWTAVRIWETETVRKLTGRL